MLDTNVLIAAARSQHGASWAILNYIVRNPNSYRLHISVPLLFEYEEQLRLRTNFSEEDIENTLLFFRQNAQEHEIYFLFRGALSDDDDAMILELAIKAQAIIVTHNVKDFHAAEDYGVRVMTPKDFLMILRNDT